MTSAAHPPTPNHQALYQQCIEQAVHDAPMLIEKLLDYARYHLRRQEGEVRHLDDRRAMADAIAHLQRHQRPMIDAFGPALRKAFESARAGGGASVQRPRALTELRFDELELLDAGQVQDHVEVARAQQMTLAHVEAALAELNPLICAVMGLTHVQVDRNPLHPQVYLRVLQDVMTGSGAPPSARMLWTLQICNLLGRELEATYQRLTAHFRAQGVLPVGFMAPGKGSPGGAGFHASNDFLPEAVDRAAPAPLALPEGSWAPSAPAVLTAASLHDLLVHDEVAAPAPDRLAAFAQRFAQEFEASSADEGVEIDALLPDDPVSDFPATLPGALDALNQSGQVDEVLERLAVQQGRERHDARAAFQERMGQDAEGTRQAVAREVVLLMIENLGRDERLLLPVRKALRDLEPVLLRLVQHDARFFSDHEHPARRFMDEVTERSLAWGRVDAPGFAEFFRPVHKALKAFVRLDEVTAAHFQSALVQMNRMWSERQPPRNEQREVAVQALQHAEQRNLMAQRLQGELAALPGLQGALAEVRDFVLGPWAQVLAEARLSDRSGEADPGGYRALVTTLVWATTPHATAANPARLTRVIPGLLTGIRQGLRTIEFPAQQTSAFLERLMGLLQAGYQAAEAGAAVGEGPFSAAAEAVTESSWPSLPGDAWLAPKEARSSGFMEVPVHAAPPAGDEVPPVPEVHWELGTWVEMRTDKGWVRSQLSWCSPHGTLFLFKEGDGSVCSMTRRVRDTLLAEGRLRVVASEPVVTGALDAVARAAILNSLEIPVRLLDPNAE